MITAWVGKKWALSDWAVIATSASKSSARAAVRLIPVPAIQHSNAFMIKLPTQPSNREGMPAMLSATILPWRLASEPMGV